MDKAKEFESLLRGWFLGNVDDDRLLDFVLNFVIGGEQSGHGFLFQENFQIPVPFINRSSRCTNGSGHLPPTERRLFAVSVIFAAGGPCND